MSVSLVGILTVVSATTVESFAQMSLKIGSSEGPTILSEPYRSWTQRISWLANTKTWMILGVILYIFEVMLWTMALHLLDVSIAFPMGSLSFVGVALLSRVFLGEAVGRVRATGVFFILMGTVCLTQ